MAKKNPPSQNPFDRSQPLNSEFFDVPLIGMVRAGFPDGSPGNYDLSELITNHIHNDAQHFTLQVLDDAMIGSGILKNDYLTIDPSIPTADRDIVVVKLGERIYVRRYFNQRNRIRLETDSTLPSSLIIENNTPGFSILGKVVSVMRAF
jgi:repressor LexA